jgi:peptide deformylase
MSSLKKITYIGCAILFINQIYASDGLEIETINGPCQNVLKMKTEDVFPDELFLAKEIVEKLLVALKPYCPAAGLAAPQIGISKSVFIYSFDRDPKNLEAVINPSFTPVSNEVVKGWEGCLSVILGDIWELAYLPRYEEIDVTYLNLEGEKIEKRLNGFAAKVFQHEFDHLQGIECINHKHAIVKKFSSKKPLMDFLQKVKEQDSIRYQKPD